MSKHRRAEAGGFDYAAGTIAHQHGRVAQQTQEITRGRLGSTITPTFQSASAQALRMPPEPGSLLGFTITNSLKAGRLSGAKHLERPVMFRFGIGNGRMQHEQRVAAAA